MENARTKRIEEIRRALKVGAGVFTATLSNELAKLESLDTPNPANKERWHDHAEDESHAPVGFSDPILGTKK